VVNGGIILPIQWLIPYVVLIFLVGSILPLPTAAQESSSIADIDSYFLSTLCSEKPPTYSNETRQLDLPCLEIPAWLDISGKPTKLVGLYSAILEISSGFNEFEVIQFDYSNIVNASNPLHAKFDVETGILNIPYAQIPTVIPLPNGNQIPGPILTCSATLQQSALRPNFLQLVDADCNQSSVVQVNYKDDNDSDDDKDSCDSTTGENPNCGEFESTPAAGKSITFGEIAIGTASQEPITISNVGTGDLHVKNISIEGNSDFSVSPSADFTLAGSSSNTLQITCTPSSKGSRSATLSLEAEGVKKFYSLSCVGEVEINEDEPVYEANYKDGETINFGEVVENGSKSKTLSVMNDGNADLVVKQVTLKDEHANMFSVSSGAFIVSTESLAKHDLEITCAPTQQGDFEATLELMTNDPNNERPSYSLSCVGKEKVVCSSIDFDPEDRNDDVIASLGFGYDKGRDLHKPQSCLKGSNTQVGGGTAKIDFTLINGYEQFKRDLNLFAELNVNAKVFKINARTNFAMSHRDTSLSKSMFLKSELFTHQQFNQQELSEFGQKMLEKGEQCFISACGDSFLYQTDIGARLIIAMKFDFTSQESKESFFAELGASYKAVDIKAAIKNVKESIIKGSSVTISAEQIGGDASRLAKVFGEDSPIVSCSLNTIKESAEGESCIEKAMKNAIDYARDEFAPNVNSKPHVLDFKTMSYSSAGIPIVLEEVPMGIISARNELVSEYQRQYSDWMLAEGWLSGEFKGDFEPAETRSLKNIKDDAIRYNLELIRNAGLWCFSDLTKCLDKKQEAYSMLKPYDQNWLYGIKAVSVSIEKSVTDKDTLSLYRKKGKTESPKPVSDSITVCVPESCEANEGKLVGRTYQGQNLSESVSRIDSRCFKLSASITPE
jgi:hypothetical protein